MLVCSIVLFIAALIFAFQGYRKLEQAGKLDTEAAAKNEQVQAEYQKYLSQVNDLKCKKDNLIEQIANSTETFRTLDREQKEILSKSLESYSEILQNTYIDKEKEYDALSDTLVSAYNKLQEECQEDYAKEKAKLDSIRATRIAVQKAQLKEKEIKEKKEFYCLPLSIVDRNDIQVLERVKSQLNKPRILSMLIWSTYFQKPMTTLCNNILGTSTVIGIYKITNQINGMCYIGQSVNVSDRWKSHAKCGLGIDTPAGNKLYKAMIDEGIWNFSWELLETCKKEDLDAKERYYIELYDSYNYGYNNQRGNGGE